MNMIEIHDLVKVFDQQEIIRHCSMNVKKGSIYGFLGRNGAGKTTILKLIAGLLKPTQGTIQISGMSMEKDRNKILKKMGCMIENPGFYEHLTAKDNLEIHLAYMGNPDGDIVHVLDQVGLADINSLPVSKFSLGMKQRLGIARAILHKPEILLLDEPINGLDPMGIKQMRDLFQSLSKEQGMTLIISSHILNEMEHIADTVGIIEGGQIIKEADTISIKKTASANLEDYFVNILNGGDRKDV